MPPEMREQSELYGVEIDSLSARLSKQLHQKQSFKKKGLKKRYLLKIVWMWLWPMFRLQIYA